MKKLALLAGAGLVAFGSIGTAEAQRRFNGDGGMRQGGNWNRTANWDRGNWNRGNWNRGYRDGYRGSTGGALAAGFVGGAVLGGIAAAAPAYGYGYPAYGYGSPAYGYGYGYGAASYGYGAPVYGYGYNAGYPVASYDDDGYYAAPAYGTRVVYSQPTVRTRVVYRTAPAVQRTRVVYRQAPAVRQRVVYQQPRARMVAQPSYNTRVTFQQGQRDRAMVRTSVRRDVVSTGSLDRREMRAQRRMMRD